MNLRSLALIGVIIFAFNLTGCAVLKGKEASPQVPEIQQQLYSLQRWKLDGRIAVKYGDEGWNANLTWEHEDRQDRLLISGPFSQGAVSIIMQSGLIYINEGNGVVTSSHEPDDLLKKRLGFSVPLPSLRYWVLGIPTPDFEFETKINAETGVRGFEQQAWVLTFENYENVASFILPQKITIQGNAVRLRLVVDEWVLKN